MERGSSLQSKEILGIAAAGAMAVGGLVVALARSLERSSKSEKVDAALGNLGGAATQHVQSGRKAAREIAGRLSATYPDVRDEFVAVAERVGQEAGALREQLNRRHAEHLVAGLVEPLSELRDRAVQFAGDHDLASVVPMDVLEFAPISRSDDRSGVRDTLVSVTVISAATAVTLLVMLSPERRERVKDALCRLMEFGQGLSDDFRGYDEGY